MELIAFLWRTFLISPTLSMRQSDPSLWQITAYLLNIRVCVRFFGRLNLLNTTPTITAYERIYMASLTTSRNHFNNTRLMLW
jgi:hypothetical protein